VSIITLVSDFGTRDAYVGVLHGVILGIHPGATVVDICHDIPAQDVRSAAFVLSTAYPYFPRGTVHVVIVDPGVGTQRRAIAMRTAEAIFVAPDNGVLSYVLARQSVLETVHLTQAHYWLAPLSETFHGRDLFAPVAAHLALGTPLHEMGPAIEDAVQFPIPTPLVHGDGSIEGEVLHVDHFGNLITNVPHSLLPAGQTVDRLHDPVDVLLFLAPDDRHLQACNGYGMVHVINPFTKHMLCQAILSVIRDRIIRQYRRYHVL